MTGGGRGPSNRREQAAAREDEDESPGWPGVTVARESRVRSGVMFQSVHYSSRPPIESTLSFLPPRTSDGFRGTAPTACVGVQKRKFRSSSRRSWNRTRTTAFHGKRGLRLHDLIIPDLRVLGLPTTLALKRWLRHLHLAEVIGNFPRGVGVGGGNMGGKSPQNLQPRVNQGESRGRRRW